MNRGYLFAAISAFLLSASIIINDYLVGFINPRMLSFLFFATVFAVTAIIIRVGKRGALLANIRRHWRDGLIVGGFNAMAATFFFLSLSLLEASTTSFLVRFSTIFIILLGVFFLKEKLVMLDYLGMAVAVAGALIINYSNASYTPIGLVVALLAALGIALHQTAAKIFVKKTDALTLVNLRTLFSFSILFVVTLATSSIQPVPLRLLPFFIASGLVAGVGFVFFYKSLELIDVSKAAVIRTLDPFIVVLYSVVLFRSVPSFQEIIGGSLIILGVITIIMKRRLNRLVSFLRKPTVFD